MEDLELYLQPLDFSVLNSRKWSSAKYSLGNLLEKNSAKLPIEKAKIVIIGIEEDRNAVVKGSSAAPTEIRKYLYDLNRIDPRLKILDLGNIKVGQKVEDTYFALGDILRDLQSRKIVTVIIGGSQDLTFGISKAFTDGFSLVNIDPRIDVEKGAKSVNSDNYLNLLFRDKKTLHSQITFGYQNYFVDNADIDYVSTFGAEIKRLGKLRYNMEEIEPYTRDADVVSFDLNSVRQMEAPGQYFSSPNGLHSEEACQIARYAGLGDNVKVGGFFNLIPELDQNNLSAKLMAQIIWHFIEGFHCRIVENPLDKSDGFHEYIVHIEDVNDLEIRFYRSRKTDRWWLRISDERIVACSPNDYAHAAQMEIPDRWWKNKGNI